MYTAQSKYHRALASLFRGANPVRAPTRAGKAHVRCTAHWRYTAQRAGLRPTARTLYLPHRSLRCTEPLSRFAARRSPPSSPINSGDSHTTTSPDMPISSAFPKEVAQPHSGRVHAQRGPPSGCGPSRKDLPSCTSDTSMHSHPRSTSEIAQCSGLVKGQYQGHGNSRMLPFRGFPCAKVPPNNTDETARDSSCAPPRAWACCH